MSSSLIQGTAKRDIDIDVDQFRTAIVSKAFKPAKGAEPRLVDKLAILNEFMLTKTVSVEERRERRFWIDVHCQIWKSLFRTNYREVIDLAIKVGMLEEQPSYSNNSKLNRAGKTYTMSYRLTDRYRRPGVKVWQLNRKRHEKQGLPSFARANLKDAGVWLDEKSREFYLPSLNGLEPWDALTGQLFNLGRHRPYRCEHGRFHDLHTGLSRVARSRLALKIVPTYGIEEGAEEPPPHLTLFDGNPGELRKGYNAGAPQNLASLDVSNCQPLLLGALALERSGPNVPNDLADWLDFCQRGLIYEFILNWLRAGNVGPYLWTPPGKRRSFEVDPSTWDRDDVKTNIMVSVFADDELAFCQPVWQCIESNWPTMASCIQTLRKPFYRALAHKLQKRESGIVIDGICSHLAQHHPDLPVLTIHDCVIVPESAELLIRDLFLDFFGRHGVRPHLKK